MMEGKSKKQVYSFFLLLAELLSNNAKLSLPIITIGHMDMLGIGLALVCNGGSGKGISL